MVAQTLALSRERRQATLRNEKGALPAFVFNEGEKHVQSVDITSRRTEYRQARLQVAGLPPERSSAKAAYASAPAVTGMLLILLTNTVLYAQSDFAVQVVEYVPGSDPVPGFTEPSAALGRPTVDTQFGFPPEKAPVVPVFPAWRNVTQPPQIVSIGAGGALTLKFGQDVYDDVNNPYGLDFIVFGNAF